ncbi:hypothetical protein QAD02_000463 [Eretmocerus hayati]|uniref:Uncharacterized protein n=1 Tax=Eretmocerus hayati TaxID=131215 RepID=A0ACC2NDC9_9HYME|nr:hypothetical protein QAD02_000463 [Eretmocerus hayati]
MFRIFFLLSVEKKTKYYLRDHLSFLIPHLGLQSSEKDDVPETKENDDDLDSCEKNDSPTVGGDEITNSQAIQQGKKHKLQEIQNKDVQSGNSQTQKLNQEIITPPPSNKYTRDRATISKLEEDTMEVTAEAVKVMTTMMSSIEEENESIYLKAIKQSLVHVPQEYMLKCVNGVLLIIDMCIEDAN